MDSDLKLLVYFVLSSFGQAYDDEDKTETQAINKLALTLGHIIDESLDSIIDIPINGFASHEQENLFLVDKVIDAVERIESKLERLETLEN